jgi:hypothetical protein
MSWLTELQKHCVCQKVNPIFSLPKQGRECLYYLQVSLTQVRLNYTQEAQVRCPD